MENMTKEEFDKLYVGKAVHCYSESQSREFLKFAKEFSYSFDFDSRLDEENIYLDYGEDTSYFINENGVVLVEHVGVAYDYGWEVVKYAITNPKTKEFRDVCKPVVEWLQKNASPMSKIIIEYGHAELVSGDIGETYDIDD